MQGVGVADGYVARLVEIVELPLQFRYGGVYHLETCNFHTSKFCKMFSLSQRRYSIRLALPRDKMNCSGGYANCFLRVALMYQPSCLLPCCQGKPGELAKKVLSKPQKQFILPLGRSRKIMRDNTLHVLVFHWLVLISWKWYSHEYGTFQKIVPISDARTKSVSNYSLNSEWNLS